MALRFYPPYSSVMGYVAHETTSAVTILPVPISVLNPASAAPASIFHLLSRRFALDVTQDGKLQSVNGFKPVQGFMFFVQGNEVSGESSVYDIFVPPSGFLEVVARK